MRGCSVSYSESRGQATTQTIPCPMDQANQAPSGEKSTLHVSHPARPSRDGGRLVFSSRIRVGSGAAGRRGDMGITPRNQTNPPPKHADSGGGDSASRLRSPSPSAHPPARPSPARSLPSLGCFSSEERRLTTSKTRLWTYVSSGAPRCSPWSTSSHIRFASWAAVFPSRAAVMSPRPEPLSAVLCPPPDAPGTKSAADLRVSDSLLCAIGYCSATSSRFSFIT